MGSSVELITNPTPSASLLTFYEETTAGAHFVIVEVTSPPR